MKLSRLLLAILFVAIASGSHGEQTEDDDSCPTDLNEDGDKSHPSNDEELNNEVKKKAITLNACRRHPTWRGEAVDFDVCRNLTGWTPRDFWWRVDRNHTHDWLEGKEEEIADCIAANFQEARENGAWWAQCDEIDTENNNCRVPPAKVVGYYKHNDGDAEDPQENGDLVIVKNILTEQEAYGIESLQKCMHKLLRRAREHEMPFYWERTFGENEEDGLYSGIGGNVVTFLTGALQLYLPGVASSLYRAMTLAHEHAAWETATPRTLGMRNAEFLEYQKTGRLGNHDDIGSIMTISVALSNPDDYEGGYFHLDEETALFKVPKRAGVVFLAKSYHGITQIFNGERKVLVSELWDDDDSPIAEEPRPYADAFEDYKYERLDVMVESGIITQGEADEIHDRVAKQAISLD